MGPDCFSQGMFEVTLSPKPCFVPSGEYVSVKECLKLLSHNNIIHTKTALVVSVKECLKLLSHSLQCV